MTVARADLRPTAGRILWVRPVQFLNFRANTRKRGGAVSHLPLSGYKRSRVIFGR